MYDRTVELLSDARAASESQGAYGLLPDIVAILEKLLTHLAAPQSDKFLLRQGAGALGRVVTDNYEFSESPLGTRLLQLVDDLMATYG